MNKIDKAAFELAMEQARCDPLTAEQLDSKLKGTRMSDGRGWAIPPAKWHEVAVAAAYHCQIKSLKLKPWQTPPCYANEDGDGPADILLRKMTEGGISRFDPNPVAALAAKG